VQTRRGVSRLANGDSSMVGNRPMVIHRLCEKLANGVIDWWENEKTTINEPLTILFCFFLQKIYEQNQEGRHSPGRI
jgi:hypothetical protein